MDGPLICGHCHAVVPGGIDGIITHTRNHHKFSKGDLYKCGHCCLTYQNLSSLTRHLKSVHLKVLLQPCSVPEGSLPTSDNAPTALPVFQNNCNNEIEDMDMDVCTDQPENHCPGDNSSSISFDPDTIERDLKHFAALATLELRGSGSMSAAAVERAQTVAFNLMRELALILKEKTSQFLSKAGLSSCAANTFLTDTFDIQDPFSSVNTIPKQMKYFSQHFGVVQPQEIFLGYRSDQRLNPDTNVFEMKQVKESFQYISVTETLTSLATNYPIILDLCKGQKHSHDGVKRGILDGTFCKDCEYFNSHPNAIRLQINVDEVVCNNPLSSKAVSQKLYAGFFSFQNLPPEINSQLSSVFLLFLAYSEDVKKYGFEIILKPFMRELEVLESDSGMKVDVNGKEVVLHAPLMVLCADTLAAHDILELLGPGADKFCRRCLISRKDFLEDCFTSAPMRTHASHIEQVNAVKNGEALGKTFGVNGQECALDKARLFKGIECSPFDIFHDILEGVGEMELKLTLKYYICEKKLFSVYELNERVRSFDYGLPDAKNKPSPNFSSESVSSPSYKLKQTGSQTWCLIRAFGFLFHDKIPDNDPHLRLINLLQQAMEILFSREISDQDILRLKRTLREHHDLFRNLHGQELIASNAQTEGDEELEAEEINDRVADTSRTTRTRKKSVNMINKHHYLLHSTEIVEMFGPPVAYWTMRYEGRNQFFGEHATVCHNYKNLPKTLAQTLQINQISSIRKTLHGFRKVGHKSGLVRKVNMTDVEAHLIGTGLNENDRVLQTNSATLNGIEFRPGLFVTLERATHSAPPKFAEIKQIYVLSAYSLCLVVQLWRTVYFERCLNAFSIVPIIPDSVLALNTLVLPCPYVMAVWKPFGSMNCFLSRKSIV